MRKAFGRTTVLVAGCTAAAIAAIGFIAAPGGAAQTAEREYTAHFEAECVLAPGVLNEKGTIHVTTGGTAPETVTPGEQVYVKNSTITVVTPKSWGESLYALGAREARGFVTSTVLDATNAEPAKVNVAKPAEFPEGLPFAVPVEDREVEFTVPSEHVGETGRTFPIGPFTVTGQPGEHVSLTVDTAPGFRAGAEEGYESTGEGIQSETSGYGANGEHDIGPLKVSCTAPSGVVEGEIPIVPSETSGGTTTTTTTASTITTTTSTTTTTEGPIQVNFREWKLRGSLTDRKLNETVTLPEGCTFNGEAEIVGKLEGRTFCPPFKAELALLGIVPSTVGLDIVESEPVKGTITHGKSGGDLLFQSTAKDIIEITELGAVGLGVPTSCRTVQPVVFPLEAEASSAALSRGVTFKGQTTVPAVRCSGADGAVLGPAITAAFSGPHNPFTFTIEP